MYINTYIQTSEETRKEERGFSEKKSLNPFKQHQTISKCNVL